MLTAYDVGRGQPRFAPVLAILDDVFLRSVTTDRLPSAVDFVRKRLGVAYKRDLLSPATKFLWLLHRNVAVIFDSQARKALAAPENNYDAYLDRWRNRYRASLPDIEAACVRVGITKDEERALMGLTDLGEVRAVA